MPTEQIFREIEKIINGPDDSRARRYIEELAKDDYIIHSFLMLKGKNDWTWEQTLMSIVIIHGEASRRFADKFHGAIRNRERDD